MLEFADSLMKLAVAESAVYADLTAGNIETHNLELYRYRRARDVLLQWKLKAQRLGICSEAALHTGEGREGIGIFPIIDMSYVDVTNESFSIKGLPEARHEFTSVEHVCPEHSASISRRGVLSIQKRPIWDNGKPVERSIPEKVYEAFGFPTFPLAA